PAPRHPHSFPTRRSSDLRCHGNGAEPGTPIKTCARCGGNGILQAVSRTPFGQVARTVSCDVCGGDGKVAEKACTRCNGRAREVRSEEHTSELQSRGHLVC